jgi:hypothetical protein
MLGRYAFTVSGDLLNILKVQSIAVRPKFINFSKEHSHILTIIYDRPKSEIGVVPVFGGGGVHFAMANQYRPTTEYTYKITLDQLGEIKRSFYTAISCATADGYIGLSHIEDMS